MSGHETGTAVRHDECITSCGETVNAPRASTSAFGVDVDHLKLFGRWNGDVIGELSQVVNVDLDAINNRHLVQFQLPYLAISGQDH